MRIAINTRFLLPGKLEGIGWFTWEVSRRLVERHPDWEFIFLFDRPWDPAFVPGPNVVPVLASPPARHPVLWWIWFELTLPRLLRRYGATHFLSFDGFCSLGASQPTLMVTHDIAHVHFPAQIPPLVRWYYHYFVPKYLNRAEQIVTVSEYSKKDIVERYQISPEKIHVACNGCRSNFRPLTEAEKAETRAQYADDQEYFFYLGAVHPRKNVARLIAAFDRFKELTKAPVLLLIGGRLSWQTGEVREAFDTAFHNQDIRLLGYVDDDALPRLTGAALALTYVSLFEGFGVPLLEAMHGETSVITSNTSSMPEVAGKAAWLVDPYDVEAITKAMVECYTDHNKRAELIKNGREQRKQFSWDRAVSVIEKAMVEFFI